MKTKLIRIWRMIKILMMNLDKWTRNRRRLIINIIRSHTLRSIVRSMPRSTTQKSMKKVTQRNMIRSMLKIIPLNLRPKTHPIVLMRFRLKSLKTRQLNRMFPKMLQSNPMSQSRPMLPFPCQISPSIQFFTLKSAIQLRPTTKQNQPQSHLRSTTRNLT